MGSIADRPDGRSSFSTIGLTILATVIAVIACGPGRKDYVPVSTAYASAQAQGVEECRAQLRGKQARIPKDTASAKTFSLCAIPGGPGSEQTGEWRQEPVRYSVETQEDRFNVHLEVELSLPQGMSNESKRQLAGALYLCQDMINATWDRSSSDAKLRLNMVFVSPPEGLTAGQPSAADQKLRLVSVPGTDESAYVMSQWPQRKPLHILASSDDLAKCSRLDSQELKECQRHALARTNSGFCADLSMMVGQWIGLEADASLAKACPSREISNVEGAGRSSEVRSLPMMRAFAALSAEDFFNEARLSADEVTQILSPVCPGLKDSTKK